MLSQRPLLRQAASLLTPVSRLPTPSHINRVDLSKHIVSDEFTNFTVLERYSTNVRNCALVMSSGGPTPSVARPVRSPSGAGFFEGLARSEGGRYFRHSERGEESLTTDTRKAGNRMMSARGRAKSDAALAVAKCDLATRSAGAEIAQRPHQPAHLRRIDRVEPLHRSDTSFGRRIIKRPSQTIAHLDQVLII